MDYDDDFFGTYEDFDIEEEIAPKTTIVKQIIPNDDIEDFFGFESTRSPDISIKRIKPDSKSKYSDLESKIFDRFDIDIEIKDIDNFTVPLPRNGIKTTEDADKFATYITSEIVNNKTNKNKADIVSFYRGVMKSARENGLIDGVSSIQIIGSGDRFETIEITDKTGKKIKKVVDKLDNVERYVKDFINDPSFKYAVSDVILDKKNPVPTYIKLRSVNNLAKVYGEISNISKDLIAEGDRDLAQYLNRQIMKGGLSNFTFGSNFSEFSPVFYKIPETSTKTIYNDKYDDIQSQMKDYDA